MNRRDLAVRADRALLAAIHCWSVYGVPRLPADSGRAARDEPFVPPAASGEAAPAVRPAGSHVR
jgi:hypothetical protein